MIFINKKRRKEQQKRIEETERNGVEEKEGLGKGEEEKKSVEEGIEEGKKRRKENKKERLRKKLFMQGRIDFKMNNFF